MMTPMRLDPATCLLAVIDVQERLLPAIPAAAQVVARCTRLATAARLLGVKTAVTEQYPRGLGGTAPALAATLPPASPKITFSCCGCAAFAAATEGVDAVVLSGLETHVCVAQTALDLLGRGLVVFVAVDAVASRHTIDHDVGLRRLEAAGVIPTTSEAVLFEWCRSAEHPRFQEIRRLVLD
jgi:nicotinamidase-related amidase